MHEKVQTISPRIKISNISTLKTKIGKTQIAAILGVQRNTIYRELKRNTPKRGRTAEKYIAGHTQSKTDKRHREKRKVIVLTDELKLRIAGLMKHEKWSP